MQLQNVKLRIAYEYTMEDQAVTVIRKLMSQTGKLI